MTQRPIPTPDSQGLLGTNQAPLLSPTGPPTALVQTMIALNLKSFMKAEGWGAKCPW